MRFLIDIFDCIWLHDDKVQWCQQQQELIYVEFRMWSPSSVSTCGELQDLDIKYLPMIDFQFCQICFPIILCSRWFICFLIVLGNQTVQSGMHKSLICRSIILVTSCLQMAESVNLHHHKYLTSSNKDPLTCINNMKCFSLLRFRYSYWLLTWMECIILQPSSVIICIQVVFQTRIKN